MRVSASLGLAVFLALFSTCEKRNYDRCLIVGTDYPCESGKFCQAIPGDPDNVGICVDAECTAATLGVPNNCPATKPICNTAGHCVPCATSNQCAAISTSLPACAFPDSTPTEGICAECAADADCVATNPTTLKPACDKATHTCRACALHSECASKVCAKDNTLAGLMPASMAISMGMCVPANRVIVLDEATCTTNCTLQAAVAAAGADKPYVLVKNYTGTVTKGATIVVSQIGSLPELHLISATADIPPSLLAGKTPGAMLKGSGESAITVSTGASVTIEGFLIHDTGMAPNAGLFCNSGGSTPTSVKLLRSLITSSDLAIKTTAQCNLTVDQCWIGTAPNTTAVSGNNEVGRLDSTTFEIVNSVFDHNFGGTIFGGITLSGTSQGRIVNSTFYRQENSQTGIPALAIYCPTAPKALTIFNNLFVNGPTFNSLNLMRPYVDPKCYAAPSALGFYATDEKPIPSGQNVITGITESIFDSAANSTLSLSVKNAQSALFSGGTRTFAGTPSGLSNASPAVDINGTPRGTTTVTLGAFEVAH